MEKVFVGEKIRADRWNTLAGTLVCGTYLNSASGLTMTNGGTGTILTTPSFVPVANQYYMVRAKTRIFVSAKMQASYYFFQEIHENTISGATVAQDRVTPDFGSGGDGWLNGPYGCVPAEYIFFSGSSPVSIAFASTALTSGTGTFTVQKNTSIFVYLLGQNEITSV